MKNLATLVLMSIIATATLTSCTDYYLDADTHYETKNQLMDDLSYSEWSLSSIKNENGEYPEYWVDLFTRLGTDVPQGVPGTNPQDLSSSPLLHAVPVLLP